MAAARARIGGEAGPVAMATSGQFVANPASRMRADQVKGAVDGQDTGQGGRGGEDDPTVLHLPEAGLEHGIGRLEGEVEDLGQEVGCLGRRYGRRQLVE